MSVPTVICKEQTRDHMFNSFFNDFATYCCEFHYLNWFVKFYMFTKFCDPNLLKRHRFLKICNSVLQFSLPMRLKQVHLFNAPPVFDALYQMAKPFLKDKTINRVSDNPFAFVMDNYFHNQPAQRQKQTRMIKFCQWQVYALTGMLLYILLSPYLCLGSFFISRFVYTRWWYIDK